MSDESILQRKAKIVATIGPASQSAQTIKQLIQAGMNVARLNFSHGTQDSHGKVINIIRGLSAELNIPVMILADLQGPKLRVGTMLSEGLLLEAGKKVTIFDYHANTHGFPVTSDPHNIPVSIPGFFASVQVGDRIYLDDGKLLLIVTETHDKYAICSVVVGGKLTSNKGINLPDTVLSTPSFTDKDRNDLHYGLAHFVDAIALSFVRSAQDIITVRDEINSVNHEPGYNPLLIAKIEKPEAIEQIDSIIEVSDGIMVARGDLAIETAVYKVPSYQKLIIAKANRQNKFVIIATQMLESMTFNPTPTRAEASDVANAVLDNADALMLSGETAVGSYPVETIQTMSSIIVETESHAAELVPGKSEYLPAVEMDSLSIARAASVLAEDTNVCKIFIFTVSGKTALHLSQTRTHTPLVAFTPNQYTINKLSVLWGIETHLIEFSSSLDAMISTVDNFMKNSPDELTGKQVIIVCGYPFGKARPPNFLYLHTIT